LLTTVATLVLLPLFIGLGRWQWHRAEYKQQLEAQFVASAAQPVVFAAQSTASLPRYAPIVVRGSWDARRQFLLDNRTRDGRAGYDVLTPLQLADGRWLIVDRGWLPASGYRERFARRDEHARRRRSRNRDHRSSGRLAGGGSRVGACSAGDDGQLAAVTSYPHAEEIGAGTRDAGRSGTTRRSAHVVARRRRAERLSTPAATVRQRSGTKLVVCSPVVELRGVVVGVVRDAEHEEKVQE
jgi:hypothetical protein